MVETSFLNEPPEDEAVRRLYESDLASDGYIGNNTRVWAWRPDATEAFTALRAGLTRGSSLTDRELAVLVTVTAAERGDSYCALAWGSRLAKLVDEETAADVLAGAPAPALTEREAALADWARRVVRDPNATTAGDVGALRKRGLDDREIFEATTLVALRLAFATVNDALGAAPDRELAEEAPGRVRAAVTWGRRPQAV
jgi:uncharacterized peroxidase-related enzyme